MQQLEQLVVVGAAGEANRLEHLVFEAISTSQSC